MRDEDWYAGEALLKDWLRRAREGQHSHHEAGKIARSLNYWLGVPAIIITTVIGTAAFASVEHQVSTTAKAWFGALSMFAAVLTVLQTHLRYSERSEQHKQLGAEYGNIRREIETILASPINLRDNPKIVLDRIRVKLDTISSEGHVVSRRTFERTLKRLARRDAARQRSGSQS